MSVKSVAMCLQVQQIRINFGFLIRALMSVKLIAMCLQVQQIRINFGFLIIDQLCWY